MLKPIMSERVSGITHKRPAVAKRSLSVISRALIRAAGFVPQ